MLLSTPVKKHLTYLRLTIAIILAYMVIFSNQRPEYFFWTCLGISLYGLSNLILYIFPSNTFYKQTFFSVLTCFDIIILAAVFYCSGYTDTQFFLLYFLVIALAAMSFDLKYLAATTSIFLAIYAWILYQNGLFSGPEATVYTLRLPFLFSVSLLFGYILHAAAFDIRLFLKKSHNALQSSMAPIVFADETCRISYANPAFLRVFGYDQAHAVEQMSCRAFLFEEDFDTIRKILREQESLFAEYPLKGKDGCIINSLLSISPVHDHLGRTVSWMISFTDITRLKTVENELQQQKEHLEKQVEKRTESLVQLNAQLAQSEESYRLLSENMLDVIWKIEIAAGDDFHWTYISPSCRHLLGYSRHETVPDIWKLMTPAGRETFRFFLESLKKAQSAKQSTSRLELELITKNGGAVWTESSVVPLRDALGNLSGLQGVTRDITGRKQAEEDKEKLQAQLMQTHKSDALGRMAGAIAHRFNNQLSVVQGNLELCLQDLPDDALVRKNCSQAMQAARRASETSRMMLTYLGQTNETWKTFDLTQFCRENLGALQEIMPDTITLKTDFPAAGPTVRSAKNLLLQLLMNLIINAWEAMDQARGTIFLSIETKHGAALTGRQIVPMNWTPQETDYACLEVRDTGCGIKPEIMQSMFDPFFTTKSTGRGLGLSVAQGIVKACHGAIGLQSREGEGSTFCIFLPCTPEAPTQTATEAPAVSGFMSKGTVLLVEDQDMVRKMGRQMLERLGFDVLEAAGGSEAVSLFSQYSERIQCVLTDLTMPRMDGWETITALRRIRPEVRVILASGYDQTQVMTDTHAEQPQLFLHKPFRLHELKAALNQILAV